MIYFPANSDLQKLLHVDSLKADGVRTIAANPGRAFALSSINNACLLLLIINEGFFVDKFKKR